MNYAKMKNVDMEALLKERGVEVPYKDGKINRPQAMALLQSSETIEQKAESRMTEKVMFVISGDTDAAGQQAVFVSLVSAEEGIPDYSALIPRDTEVTVPLYVYNYIQSLYTIEHIPYEDEDGNIATKERRVKRFKIDELERITAKVGE